MLKKSSQVLVWWAYLPFQGHVNTSLAQAERHGLSVYGQRKHFFFFFLIRLNNYISNFYVLKWTNTIGSEVGITKNSITNKVLLAFTGVGFQFSTIFFPNLLLRFYNITNHLTNSILIPESFTSSIVAIPLYWYDSCNDLYMDLESVFPLEYGHFPPNF